MTTNEKNKLVANLLQISGIYMKGSKLPIEMTLVEKAALRHGRYTKFSQFRDREVKNLIQTSKNFLSKLRIKQ